MKIKNQNVEMTRTELYYLYMYFYQGDKTFIQYCESMENKQIKVVDEPIFSKFDKT